MWWWELGMERSVGCRIWAANHTTEHCGLVLMHSWAVPDVVCMVGESSAGYVVAGVVQGEGHEIACRRQVDHHNRKIEPRELNIDWACK
jgi:hypothetical protein